MSKKMLKSAMKGAGMAKDLAELGGALGTLIGAASKKKKGGKSAKTSKTKKKKNKSNPLNQNVSTTVQAMPVRVGIQHKSVRHKPFVLTGNCIMATLQTSASNATLSVLGNADGVNATQMNVFAIMPTGGTQTSKAFKMFPDTVRNIAYMFERCRVNKLVVTWEPLAGTNAAQSICFGSIGTQVFDNTTKSYYDLAAWENNVITPVWAPAKLDLLKGSGFNRGWLYQENTLAADVDQLRWESPGSFGAAVLNGLLTTLYGTFRLEYEIEFDQLHDIQSLYTGRLVGYEPQPVVEHVVVDNLPSSSPALPAGQDPSPETVAAARQLLSQVQQQTDDGKSVSSTPSLVSGSATPARPGWFQASQRYAGLETR